MSHDFWSLVFGRLDVYSLDFLKAFFHPDLNDVILSGSSWVVIIGAVITAALLSWFRLWGLLWSKWLISVDHKRIGVMYIALALVMLVRGALEGVVMRAQQADGLHGGFLSADHFAQLFSTHGTIMIFFMAMPFLTGLMNIVVPLQIGARDVSFPMLNSLSLGLTVSGAMLVMISLVIGDFSTGGWSAYPPYTERNFQPGAGPDYWIWAVTLAGLGSTLTGINFVVTIFKERAPGMNLLRMPIFTWNALCTSLLLVFAMPPLTVAALMLAGDRYLGFHFFTNSLGGNMMNYANLFWQFGHPEVYILVLPSFGIYGEVISTYSGKRLYGYVTLVIATMAIGFLSFGVWLHHFFTMGQDSDVNAVFGIATMLIGIPTGVKVYDWMATMFRGRIRFSVPMVYALAFMVLFVLGGLTGILLANPPVDFQVHNTLFLVAHFHNMLIPGTLFGLFAGYTYWFPKVFGFRLNERWGYIAACSWIVGFVLAFMPLYAVGLMGMTRRAVSYANAAFEPWFLVADVGAFFITIALVSMCVQLYVSIRDRELARDIGGDPWDARTLEWATPSPVPSYNFPVIPHVHALDAFAVAKEAGLGYQEPASYSDVYLPGDTNIGVVTAVFGTALGFGLVWYMWWLALVSLAVIAASLIGRALLGDRHPVKIPATEIRQKYKAWLEMVQATSPVTRALERDYRNHGVAAPEYTREAAE
jgi:cytochrome o ubiquinol oxidase subunit I